MPDIMKDYEHLNTKDDNWLFNRQSELKASASGNMKDLSDDALQELLAIARVLRKRTTAPTARKSTSTRAPAPTLDAL